MADNRGLRGAAGFGHFLDEDARQLVVRAGQADPDIVEHALPGELAHLHGQRLVGDGAGPLGQGLGEVRGTRYRSSVHVIPPQGFVATLLAMTTMSSVP